MLTTKRIAKKIVQRSRLRSTSEPPPSEPPAAADAEGAGEPGVLARVQEHEEDQDDRDRDLDDVENGFHRRGSLAIRPLPGAAIDPLQRGAIASRRSSASSSLPKSSAESLPCARSSSASRISRYLRLLARLEVGEHRILAPRSSIAVPAARAAQRHARRTQATQRRAGSRAALFHRGRLGSRRRLGAAELARQPRGVDVGDAPAARLGARARARTGAPPTAISAAEPDPDHERVDVEAESRRRRPVDVARREVADRLALASRRSLHRRELRWSSGPPGRLGAGWP